MLVKKYIYFVRAQLIYLSPLLKLLKYGELLLFAQHQRPLWGESVSSELFRCGISKSQLLIPRAFRVKWL